MKNSGLKNKFVISVLREFINDFGIGQLDEYKQYEYLANYLIISKMHPEAFESSSDLISVDADSGSGYGIDAAAVIVNGNLVTDVKQIKTFASSRNLEVTFVFIQTKTSDNFDAGNILKLVSAVNNFFSEDSEIKITGELQRVKEISEEVLSSENIRFIDRKKYPEIKMFYVTSGKEVRDSTITQVANQSVKGVQLANPDFANCTLDLLGADYMVDTYNDISNQYTVELFFDKKLEMNEIEKVAGSYIGYLDFNNFMNLITDTNGVIRKNIFYENVRDFQGEENKVNSEISETLSNPELRDKFILLNNGITVVAKRLIPLQNNKYELGDFQVVNGCQTSNMIYLHRDALSKDNSLMIPIKLIYTTDNDVTNRIVRATNRQTPVPDEAFIALEKFHQDLQRYYELESNNLEEKIYYERRSKEYQNDERGIQKFKIVNIYKQIRAFTAVMLNEPHTVASNNPNNILRGKENILFDNDHKKEPYFASAYILYFVNSDLANGLIKGRDNFYYQFYIAMIIRILITEKIKVSQFNGEEVEKDFKDIIQIIKRGSERRKIYRDVFRILNNSRREYLSENPEKSHGEIIRTKAFKDIVIQNLAGIIYK